MADHLKPGPAVPERFVDHIKAVTNAIADRPVAAELAAFLDERFPAGGDWFREMSDLCRSGCEEGWLCQREQDGIRFGRPVKPSPVTDNFSVDVVRMRNVKGPHHSHPHGEIDLVIPLDEGAKFDGRGAGWTVYEPESAHFPTVSGGSALVLYLLPHGSINFTLKDAT